MVTRTQIENANIGNRTGVVYTCNCGWLDMGHANPRKAAAYIGAVSLWEQFLNEVRQVVNVRAMSPAGGFTPTLPMRDLTMPDGTPAFLVRYKQDMGKIVLGARLTVGEDRSYVVRQGLSNAQKKQVALAIFMEVTFAFESFQGWFPESWVHHSSFSVEDLVSNLIGFYIAVGETTWDKMIEACHPISTSAALAIWDRGQEGVAWDELKNKTFEPVFAKSTVEKPGATDECGGQPRAFPALFKTITPAKKGTLFVNYSP
ncbi:MAG: hypothetical protein KIT36_12490 [Alphaproteobacteria bacterium]|nr:hypothetical protein [Alphaproteobacteria bacterium]